MTIFKRRIKTKFGDSP